MSDAPQKTTRSSRRKAGKTLAVSVYLLTFTNGKSYVGITSNLRRRIRDHRKNAENGKTYALSNAWRKHGEPLVKQLFEVDSYETAFWLEQLMVVGHGTKAPNGYNMTDGGDGIRGITPEKLLEMGRQRSRRYWEDDEYRAKMQDAQRRGAAKGAVTRKAWYQTPEGRASIEARTQNLEWRDAVAASNRTRVAMPEQRALRKKATTENWEKPEYREKVNAAREAKQAELRATNPEWVKARAEKVAATMRAKWQDLEYLAKMAKRKAPVISTKTRKAAAAKRVAAMTTEKREAIAEKTRQQWARRKASQSES